MLRAVATRSRVFSVGSARPRSIRERPARAAPMDAENRAWLSFRSFLRLRIVAPMRLARGAAGRLLEVDSIEYLLRLRSKLSSLLLQ